jgi:phytoene dehydrogenase-like protein
VKTDAVVVGAGPNGLAAAIELARAGRSVTLYEANPTLGGGASSEALTLPGFIHDRCSAVHPLALGSPFFRQLPLARHGLEWIQPPVPVAHPLDDGTAVVIERDIAATASGVGQDGRAWRRVVGDLAQNWERLASEILGPVLHWPRHPLTLARFGPLALMSARGLALLAFRGRRARAVFSGLAAHSFLSLDAPFSATFALLMGSSAHAIGWPIPRGGSQRISDALAAHLRELGGQIFLGTAIGSVEELPSAHAILFDVTPRQLERIAGNRLPQGYRAALRRYRYGPGVFKLDYALDGPVPWKAPECGRASTVHLGGDLAEVAASEAEVARGRHPERPFALVAQPSLFDGSRAPAGKHVLWAYCHVPNGSTMDMTARIEAQIERFAPGFHDRILARHAMTTADLEAHNQNLVGGDISGGSHDGLQLIARPMLRLNPYATPARDIYLCSSSTPPGGGVHGMCGYHAARSALGRAFA